MNKHTVIFTVATFCTSILYGYIPVLGLLKAYSTDNSQWYWLCSTWSLPFLMLMIIPIVDSYTVRNILRKTIEEIKLVASK